MDLAIQLSRAGCQQLLRLSLRTHGIIGMELREEHMSSGVTRPNPGCSLPICDVLILQMVGLEGRMLVTGGLPAHQVLVADMHRFSMNISYRCFLCKLQSMRMLRKLWRH